MKNTFKFEPMTGLVDVYIGEFKLKAGHNGSLGQIALHLQPKYAEFLSVEPHDQRIGIDIEITDTGELTKFKRPVPVNPKPALPLTYMK